ncbi:MAG: LptA/OstA family protein [Terracidiphilus sp.]|nr:LptA/OstA family protein [Terracidiphilus sp.]
MRFTIERIRTLVVVAAALLLVALGIFLARAKWKNLLSRRDLPQRLGLGITEESNGYSYSHNLGAHSKYKIHAAKEIHLKNDHVELHDVVIEIYGEDGIQTDKIAGDEFEYDQKSGIASAKGPVEMMLTRPPGTVVGSKKPAGNGKKVDRSHTVADALGDAGQVQVKTSGVSFDRNTGVLTTAQRVDFTMTQGSGSAVGATYDSQRGYLTLVQAVELTTYRGEDKVQIRAQHAEFDRGSQECLLRAATMDYRDGQTDAAQAKILFRGDGSAAHLDATGGFVVTTSTGGRLASPTAAMDFDEHSQPRHGHLEGGVTMDSKQEGASAQEGRTVHGASPTAELDFTAQGQLRHAHLERGVTMQSEASSLESAGQMLHVSRTWRSPVADVDFRTIKGGGQTAGKTQEEPETIHGTGGVVITSESRRGNAPAVPAKMIADDVTGTFGAGATLRTLVGTGHAGMEQTTATGAQQRASGDRLTAQFVAEEEQGNVRSPVSKSKPGAPGGAETAGAPNVQTAELDGHVTLFEQPAARPGAQPQPPLRGTAGKAVYEGAGEWLHLTLNPRIVNGGLELTADKVDVSRQSDDAFAHGNVKATWTGGDSTGGGNQGGTNQSRTGQGSVALGGNGPAHVIAAEAQMNQSTEEAIFRGHARLWQQANSVAAPEIVLNQQLQTLTARTTDAADPVRAVLLSQSAPGAGIGAGNTHGQGAAGRTAANPEAPSVIRVRGGDLKYSAAEHRAVMHGGVAGAVVAETGSATSTSDTVDLLLAPAGKGGGGQAQGGQAQTAGGEAQSASGQAQVDRMTATGHVVLVSEGRRGTGEQLVYSGATGDYVLTGTAAARPRMTDPGRGNVTGEVLIFHSRDDSVSIEGGGHQTRTETTAPQMHGR